MSHPLLARLLAEFAWRIWFDCRGQVIVRTSKKAGLSRVCYLRCPCCGWGGKKVVPIQTSTTPEDCQETEVCHNTSMGDTTCDS